MSLGNQINCVLPKYNGGTGPGQTFPFKKKDIKKKERALSSAARESPRAAMKTQRSRDYVNKKEGICYS